MQHTNDWAVNWSDKSLEDLKKITEDIKSYDDYSYQCSTHIDALNDVIDIAKVKSAIEFGGGYWSTSLLLHKCDAVKTVEQGQHVPREMNDLWAEKLKDLYRGNRKWTFIKSPGKEEWKSLTFSEYDLAFIDGFPTARHELLQFFIDNNCPVIVAHDTEHDGFQWSEVDIKEYRRVDYCGCKVNRTTIWTKDIGLIEALLKSPNYVLVRKSESRIFKINIKKVISFSLWGENPMYWNGAMKNIELAKTLYPGWICRFYVDAASPAPLIKMIDEADCEMVLMEPSDKFVELFWRFYAAEDADIMICRDTDSRLSIREVEAVEKWLDTEKHFHIMRDHPQHNALIPGGMWGCRNMAGMRESIMEYQYKCLKGTDQLFLAEIIYPQIKEYALIHDSYNLVGDGLDFPTSRVEDEFVGRSFDHVS